MVVVVVVVVVVGCKMVCFNVCAVFVVNRFTVKCLGAVAVVLTHPIGRISPRPVRERRITEFQYVF